MHVLPGQTSDPETRHQARTRIGRWNRAMLRRGTPFERRLVPWRSDGGFAVPTVLFMLLARVRGRQRRRRRLDPSAARGRPRPGHEGGADGRRGRRQPGAAALQPDSDVRRQPVRGLGWRHAVRGAAGGRLVPAGAGAHPAPGRLAYTVAPTDGADRDRLGWQRRTASHGGSTWSPSPARGQQIFSDATVKSQDGS